MGRFSLVSCGNRTGVPGKISPLIEELLHISHSTDLAVRITEVQYSNRDRKSSVKNLFCVYGWVCMYTARYTSNSTFTEKLQLKIEKGRGSKS